MFGHLGHPPSHMGSIKGFVFQYVRQARWGGVFVVPPHLGILKYYANSFYIHQHMCVSYAVHA